MKKKKVTLKFDRLPPSINSMLREHWAFRAEIASIWNQWCMYYWAQAGRMVFLNPVRIHYVLTFRTQRLRDIDNYVGGTKYINDALKRTFILRDDYKKLKGITVEFRTGDKESTVLTIEEA